MACLNTNGFLAPTGIGLFGNPKGVDIPCNTPVFTKMNVIGWFPIAGTISGLWSFICCKQLWDQGDDHSVEASIAFGLRGILQIAQVGIILAPFDIGFSLARLVREHMKHRAAHHATS